MTLESIRAARRRIDAEIIRTPLVLSGAASDRAGMLDEIYVPIGGGGQSHIQEALGRLHLPANIL